MVQGYSRVRQNQIRQCWKEEDYKLIQKLHKERNWSITTMCRILEISRASYYKWLKRKEKEPDQEEEDLLEQIRAIAKKNNCLFGCRKMAMVLSRKLNRRIGVKKVYRLMARNNMLSVYRRKKHTYKKSDPVTSAENILNREFGSSAPNEKWVTDITEIHIPGSMKKLYLSTILDLYDRSVVAWNISPRNDSALVDETLDRALEANPDGCRLFHSDRGFQYTRPGFAARLKSLDITQSMSRVSCCIDNGCEESFQGILKDMMSILYPDTDSLESAQEAVRKTIEYYMNEYPQERFGGRTAAEVRAEAFKTEIPPEYPIKPNLRIEKFWDRIAQKRVNRQ